MPEQFVIGSPCFAVPPGPSFAVFFLAAIAIASTPAFSTVCMLLVARFLTATVVSADGRRLFHGRALLVGIPVWLALWMILSLIASRAVLVFGPGPVVAVFGYLADYLPISFFLVVLLVSYEPVRRVMRSFDSARAVQLVRVVLPPGMRDGAEGMIRDYVDKRDQFVARGLPPWPAYVLCAWYLTLYVLKIAIWTRVDAILGRILGP